MLVALEIAGGPLDATVTVLLLGSKEAVSPEPRAGLKNTVRVPSVGPLRTTKVEPSLGGTFGVIVSVATPRSAEIADFF